MIKLDHLDAVKSNIVLKSVKNKNYLHTTIYIYYLTIEAYVLINNRHELTIHS